MNLKSYDGVAHSVPRALSGPNGNTGNPDNTAYWAYPSNTPKPAPNQAQMDPTNATTYDNNQRLGLLYTWDAATAGKGGSTGQLSRRGLVFAPRTKEITVYSQQGLLAMMRGIAVLVGDKAPAFAVDDSTKAKS